MDLADLKPKSDTVEVILKHPKTEEVLMNPDGTEMTITVYLPHSKEHKKARHKRTDLFIKKGKQNLTAAEIEDLGTELLAETTKEWNITFNGEKPKLNMGNAKKIYEEVFWIKPQVEGAIGEALDFTIA